MAEPAFKPRTFRRPKPAPKKEKSTFAAFEAKKVEVTSTELDEESIIEILLQQDPKVWIPLLIVAKDSSLGEVWRKEPYSLKLINALNERFAGEYSKDLTGYPINSLCSAISRIAANIVYTNDNGDAYFAFDGLGILDGTSWTVPVQPKSKNVVPISSAHAVDVQLFQASVTISKETTYAVVNEVVQNISKPVFVKKNVPDKQRIPYSIKEVFLPLLVNLPEDLDTSHIQKAPWIWEHVAACAKTVNLPIDDINLSLAYFSFVKQSYGYQPSPLDIKDVMYQPYPFINKDIFSQLNKYSFVVGGVPVQPGHFFNYGAMIAKKKHFGGFVPDKYCAFNTNNGVTWERNGCYVESTLLNTKVEAIRPVTEFNGMWYDPVPAKATNLVRAVGLIVPYDSAGRGLACVDEWVALKRIENKRANFNLWASYGKSPLLWIELDDEGHGYSRVAADDLWKCMPTMNLYNFCASLNRNAALALAAGERRAADAIGQEWEKDLIPYDPVATLEYVGRPLEYNNPVSGDVEAVPEFEIVAFSADFLPGRHLQKEKPQDVAEDLVADFDMYAAHVRKAVDADAKGRKGFAGVAAKKRKAE